jgi:hypothetical protein
MIIEFKSVDEISFDICDKPYPASKITPEWWKNSNVTFNKSNDLFSEASTFKRCMPILDLLGSGYIVPLHADIEVKTIENNPILSWSFVRPVVEQHLPERVNGIEIPDGYSDSVFKYMTSWTIKTPPGYSCLITHPFGYKKLPFYSFSGIVDSDLFFGDINTPFVIKNNFSGLIPKGTPMMQIFPFKRDNWESKITQGTSFERQKVMGMLSTKIHSGYKKMFRQKKTYI